VFHPQEKLMHETTIEGAPQASAATQGLSRGNGHDPGAAVALAAKPPSGMARLRALDAEAREELRRKVEETPVAIEAIASEISVPRSSLDTFYKEQGWTRPKGAAKSTTGSQARPRSRLPLSFVDAGAVKVRLLRAVDRQIQKIDARTRKKGASVEEKDARTLGTLAKTLETLMALERDGGAKAETPEPIDREEIRAAVARRIAQWAGEGA
jgi:hypothetical protein